MSSTLRKAPPVVLLTLFMVVMGGCSSASEPTDTATSRPSDEAATTDPAPQNSATDETATTDPAPQNSVTAATSTPRPTAPLATSAPTPPPSPAATTVEPTATADPNPAPGRPSGGPNAGSDPNPAWLGRGDMSADAIELVWSTGEVEASIAIHRFPFDSVEDPDAVPLGPDSLIYDGAATAYVDTALVAGERYVYVLDAETDDGTHYRRWSEAHAVTDTEPPSEVGEVTAVETAEGIELSWQRSSDDYLFARYAIRRSVDGAPSVYYGTGWTLDQTSFIDDQAPTSGTVEYEVFAVDFHGNLSAVRAVRIER